MSSKLLDYGFELLRVEIVQLLSEFSTIEVGDRKLINYSLDWTFTIPFLTHRGIFLNPDWIAIVD